MNNSRDRRPRLTLAALLLGSCAMFLPVATLSAQPGLYTLTVSDVTVPPGQVGRMLLTLDNPNGQAVRAMSTGICSDPLVASPTNVTLGSDVTIANLGAPPDFEEIYLYADGFTVAMVVNFVGAAAIAPGSGLELFVIDYTPVGAFGDTTTLDFCNSLGTPPVDTTLVIGGTTSVTPSLVAGTLEIGAPPPLQLSIDAPTIAVPGSSVDLSVRMTNAASIEAFSLGLAPGADLTITAIDPAGDLALTNGGNGPAFFDIDLAPPGGNGATVECAISATAPFASLAPSIETELLAMTCTVDASAGPPCSFVPIAFVDTLGSPAVPLTGLTPLGAQPATTIDGAVEIGIAPPAPPSGGIRLRIADVGVDAGDDADVPVTLDCDQESAAFSFGIEYDATDVLVTSVTPGSLLSSLHCGNGPDYFAFDLFTIPDAGVTVGAVHSISPPFTGGILPAGSEMEIAVLHFTTDATPNGNGSALTFTGSLGSTVPVAIEVTIGELAVSPSTVGGSLTFGSATGEFVRGECNSDGQVNLADAVYLLNALFPTGGSPSVINCEDACDGNDDGLVNLADAVRILNVLFVGAGPFAAPDGVCGGDPTSDTLGCDTSPPCP